MFGITFSKLLIIATIVAGLWFLYRYLQRIEKLSKMALDRKPQARAPDRDGVVAEEMVKCRVCDAYVAARGASSCGRKECPFG